jgi:hypothetical protein
MMDEYIERSELIRFVDNIEEDHMGSNTRIVLDMPGLRYLARQIPSADVVPVVHGRWIHDINNLYGCSECMERETMSPKKLKPYCPNCGAHMKDGE